MRSTLFETEFTEVDKGIGFQLQNDRTLKIELHRRVLAARTSAIAWQGDVQFKFRGSGVRRWLKRAFSGEGVNLMEVMGSTGADVFCGIADRYVHILLLEDERLTINGSNVLAFDPELNWDIHRVRGFGGMVAAGFSNVVLEGSGPVAITTRSKPMLLNTAERRTTVDPSSLVAWSAELSPLLTQHGSILSSLIGRETGEIWGSSFYGDGWVLVENAPPERPFQ